MRIHIVTSQQTFKYFEYCVRNHIALADNPKDLSFVAYCLDDISTSQVSAMGHVAIRLPNGSGSIAHMNGIRAALSNLSDDIDVISDSDCIVLMYGWDTKLRELMATYGTLGTTYEDLGGFSSGDGAAQTYKRVPNFSWIALSPKYNWDFDVSADKANLFAIENEEQSKAFNLPIGYSLFREPCWKFPIHLSENSIPYYSLEFVRPTSGHAKAVLSGEDYHTEYTLSDDTPFVAHQRGSMSKEFRVHHLSKTFYDACEAYIAKQVTQ